MNGVRAIRTRPIASSQAPVLVGLAAAFVVAVDLARWIRPGLLLDGDPSWAAQRLVLGFALVAAAAAAGIAAGLLFRSFAASRLARAPLLPLRLSGAALAAVTLGALGVGIAVRAAVLASPAIPFLEDEVNLIGPALELSGTSRDFADAIVAIPRGRPDPHEVIGVAYLGLLRASLEVFGSTITGLRMTSLLGGVLSLVTTGILARRLLPSGGAAAAVLILAGMRWHAILSLAGWHSVLLLPIVDLATILLLRARRRASWLSAAGAGAVMGVGPHFYLASWIAATALWIFAAWPPAAARTGAAARRVLAFAAGFALVVAPLFLLTEGRRVSYFGRADRHSALREMQYRKSPMPIFAAAADALPAPWLVSDPEPRHDLAKRPRLGWFVGALLAVGLARAAAKPREELSGLLLLHAATAAAAAVAGGTAGHPNGFRFGYLADPAAIASASGLLALAAMFPERRRRAAALAGLGLAAVSGAAGLRQASVEWPGLRATFDSFRGEDTLIGRAAARWDRYGTVVVEPNLGRSDLTIDTVRRYRLDSAAPLAAGGPSSETRGARLLRVAARGSSARPGERVVEWVRDGWGREWAVVLALPAKRTAAP